MASYELQRVELPQRHVFARIGSVFLLALLASSAAHGEVTEFLVEHCSDCHSGDSPDAGLDVTALELPRLESSSLHESKPASTRHDEASFARWVRIYDRVAQGEMPPPDTSELAEEDRAAFTLVLRRQLERVHNTNKATTLRRLNRSEYENTLNDLFGTNVDLAERLPADGRSHEFDNVGDSLSISMLQMQRYLECIDAVMEEAIAESVRRPEPTVTTASYAETREGEKFIGDKWLLLDDGAVVFFQDWGYPTGMLRDANVRQRGKYRIRVTGYAYQSSTPITFALGATTFQRGLERPTFGYYAFPPLTDAGPTTLEIEAWIENRYMIEITPQRIFDSEYKIKNHGIESYTGPGLAILSVELEGPIYSEFPSRGHALLFGDVERREIEPSNPATKLKSWYVPQFEILSSDPTKDAGRILLRVATMAFRRSVESVEVEPFEALFAEEFSADQDFERALRTAVAAIFCSPEFLFLRENPGWLDDYALASRLSYFLTRTAPDAELMQLANEGRLASNPQVLAAQVDRLLEDPRSERFVKDFTDAWLNLRDIDFTSPDRALFPEYDAYLQFSMLAETRRFFRKLITDNLPVANVVQSKFAILNERLSEHYGIADVEGPQMRTVELPKDSLRGGLLAQASVLKVSANGSNTSPVVRGAWVLDRLLGTPPPPPPPGIAGVEPDTRGAATLRELLDRHRELESCNTCHKLIDPPGFALECFNPIGGHRVRFRTLGDGEKVLLEVRGRKVRYKLGLPVDASGVLEDGSRFSDFRQFRELLRRDETALARALSSKLLVFATGREMGFSDREPIKQIVEAAGKRELGVRDLIHEVVLSPIFRRK